jgi:transposase
MERAVDRGLYRRTIRDLEYIGIDEKSMKKGHKYMTVVSDFTNKSVIDLCEGRSLDTTAYFLNSLKNNNDFTSLKAVSIDMWRAYISSIKKVFPDSDIVHDRFHIMKYLNNAVNSTRILENKELIKQKNGTLIDSKYLYLRNEENMSETQIDKFSRIKNLDLKTSKAWRIKETFKAFFDCDTINKAKSFFSQWYLDVKNEKIPHMIEVAEMLRNHIEGLLSYSKHKISNGIAENINGRIQRIKTVGRGFRAFKNYRTVIMFHLGNLDLFQHRSL